MIRCVIWRWDRCRQKVAAKARANLLLGSLGDWAEFVGRCRRIKAWASDHWLRVTSSETHMVLKEWDGGDRNGSEHGVGWATHTHAHARTHAHTHTRTHARTHTHTHARTHARTHTQTNTHRQTHTGKP